MNKYLVLHPVVEDRMTQLVLKLQKMLDSVPEGGMVKFTQELGKFCQNMEVLFATEFPPVQIVNTFFCINPVDFDLVSRAVTSHLQTHCSTVVTGPDESSVNMYVQSLALFLGPKERKRAALTAPNREYIPDLLLQGIVGNSIQLQEDKVIESILPTTWVDLEKHIVKQTHPFHEYAVLRKEFILLEADKLVGVYRPNEQNMWSTREGLFRPLRGVSPMVSKMLVEVLRLPHSLREGYIAQMMRLLIRKAVVLIKYVEAELAHTNTLGDGVVKKIRTDLSLTNEADFAVLLGLAEKLKPGVYVTLAGDPTTIEEVLDVLFLL